MSKIPPKWRRRWGIRPDFLQHPAVPRRLKKRHEDKAPPQPDEGHPEQR